MIVKRGINQDLESAAIVDKRGRSSRESGRLMKKRNQIAEETK